MKTINLCQFGAGRIGVIHAGNAARHPRAKLLYVVDVDEKRARAVAEPYGARVAGAEAALADSRVDAVIIASSSDTHCRLIEAASRAGKAIFCEKPIDLDVKRVDAAIAVVAKAGVPFMVGFNRRFDPSFAALHERVRSGAVGAVELVAITSRDPAPPPIEAVRTSGGLFRDMMIHDFDMACWLMAEEPVEVFAAASSLVDPEIARAGDVDTAVVTLKTARGALCQISNSRRAAYGYDQRLEVFGSKGMARAINPTPTTVELSTEIGVTTDKLFHFFLERYAEAYRRELDTFLDCVATGVAPRPGAADGRRALVLADAAEVSARSGKTVRV